MSTATLTSLAMLKVTIDHGGDYLDYLRPFILQVLVDERPDPVTEGIVQEHIRTHFGLEIPEQVIQVVLKRISRNKLIKKKSGTYKIVGELSDPGISARKHDANKQIQEVIHDFIRFSQTTKKPITSNDIAEKAILVFLSQFNITCLKAYLRETALPSINDDNSDTLNMLVSKYIIHLQKTSGEKFESFMVLVQGHMLANALMCPDLQSAPATYRKVTFYLDTPLLVPKLGLDGEMENRKVENLISLLKNLSGSLAIFSHTRDELVGVIRSSADHINDVDSPRNITREARRTGRTKSDLLLMAEKIDDYLIEAQIKIKQTPHFSPQFQIDEADFEEILDKHLMYQNPKTKEYDINSVRSIYTLREKETPTTIEKAKAILVTSNVPFARAAWEYGKSHHEVARDVSSVVNDFSLANMAWLKGPMGSSSLPEIETLAFSYAAFKPSEKLLGRFLTEVDRLGKQNIISPRDHQLLRGFSGKMIDEELMSLTLGDETALTSETITEIAERITQEISREATEKFDQEKMLHKKTQEELAEERTKSKKMQDQLYWRCDKKAKLWSGICAGLMILVVIVCVAYSTWWGFTNSIIDWGLVFITTIVTICSLVFGESVMGIRKKLKKYFLNKFRKLESVAMGVNLEDK